MTITTLGSSLECSTSLSAPSGRAGPGAPGQCRRCGYVRPLQEQYTVLLVAVDATGKIFSSMQVVELSTPSAGVAQVRVNGVLASVKVAP